MRSLRLRSRPQVCYRETVRATVKHIEGRVVQQRSAPRYYGVVVIDMEPAPGEGFSFINKIEGGSVPSEFIPAVEKGCEEALVNGVKAGYPMVDIRVTLVDGKYHDTDSSEIAFKLAGSAVSRGSSSSSSASPMTAMSFASAGGLGSQPREWTTSDETADP